MFAARLAAAALLLLLAGCTPTPAPPTEQTPPPFASATTALTATSEDVTEAPETEAVPTSEPTTAPAETSSPRPSATATATFRPSNTVTAGPGMTATATGTDVPQPTSTSNELIHSFEANPLTIDPGDSVTLSWEATGDTATLYRLAATGQFAQFWDMPLTGEKTLQTSDRDRNAVRYALYVQQGEVLESAMVSVTLNCTAEWFFNPAPDICPLDPVVVSAAAYQPFERGTMFWLGARVRIYVLYADTASHSYSALQDPWHAGLPESDPGIEPPAGYVQPVRGFGMVWRGEDSAYLNVRERLGWGLEPETGYTASFQCDSPPKYVTCYLTGPDGRVWVLEPEGSGWSVLEGAAPR